MLLISRSVCKRIRIRIHLTITITIIIIIVIIIIITSRVSSSAASLTHEDRNI